MTSKHPGIRPACNERTTFVCVFVAMSVLISGSLKRADQVEFLAALTGEDGRLLVVLDQLVHSGKPPLTDAEDAIQQLDLEVFVLPSGFQGDGEVIGLQVGTREKETE